MNDPEETSDAVQRIIENLKQDEHILRDLRDLNTLLEISDGLGFPNNTALYDRDITTSSFNLPNEINTLREKINKAITEIETRVKDKIREHLTDQITSALLKQIDN